MDYSNIDSIKLDALNEVGNIGVGHAATTLSSLIKEKVMIEVCSVDLRESKGAAGILESESDNIVDVHLGISGDLNGNGHFLISEPGARNLLNMLGQHFPESGGKLGNTELAALKKCGSSVLIAYLNAITEFLKISLALTSPEIKCTGKKNIVFNSQLQGQTSSKRAFSIKTVFLKNEIRNNIFFILVLDDRGLELIFQRLGI